MKKILLAVLTLAVILNLGVSAFAQGGYGGGDTKPDNAAPSVPLKDIKGTIKADGGKVTFVEDKGGKSWDIMNPEMLKGHEGHHVQLKAHVYADKSTLHVMGVKMIKAPSNSSY